MNIKELVESWEGKSKEQIIESLMNELEIFNKEEKENTNKIWKPEYGEYYFCIDADGDVAIFTYEDDDVDKFRYLIGNMFKTKEETEEYAKKIKFQAKFKNFVKERNNELNWNDYDQSKWYMYYNHYRKEIMFLDETFNKNQGTIYASSEQILKDAINEIGEENVKKYILEVL